MQKVFHFFLMHVYREYSSCQCFQGSLTVDNYPVYFEVLVLKTQNEQDEIDITDKVPVEHPVHPTLVLRYFYDFKQINLSKALDRIVCQLLISTIAAVFNSSLRTLTATYSFDLPVKLSSKMVRELQKRLPNFITFDND